MPMKNPSHPGSIVKHDCLEPLGLTVTKAAEWLGVSRVALSELLNGRAGMSPEMALRLEAAGWVMPKAGCSCSSATISPRLKTRWAIVSKLSALSGA